MKDIEFIDEIIDNEQDISKRIQILKTFIYIYEMYQKNLLRDFKKSKVGDSDNSDIVIRIEGLPWFWFSIYEYFFEWKVALDELDKSYVDIASVALCENIIPGHNKEAKEFVRNLFRIIRSSKPLEADSPRKKVFRMFVHIYGDEFDPQCDPTPKEEEYKDLGNYRAYNFYKENCNRDIDDLYREAHYDRA